ncbi:MAG: hypothetical protein WKF58_07355 [Ilumatobacteraceae bacterium]
MLAAACGSSSSSSPAASSTSPSPGSALPVTAPAATAVDPNAPEVVEPGDIPDDQAFVTYPAADGTYSVDVPEGWARSEQTGAVTFTDKYNTVTVQTTPADAAPTVESVAATGLVDVSADPTFTLVDVAPVTRKVGDGVLATYEIGSAPNSVTGKQALLAVERYVFFRNGTDLVLTLSGAKGADNVDPWRIVSDSLTWT